MSATISKNRSPPTAKENGINNLDYKNRLKTFQELDECDANTLTQRGFFYTNCANKIKCIYCGLTVDCQPNLKHDCPRTDCDTSHLPYNLNLIMPEDRLKTFQHWTGTADPVILAQSGFYYTQVIDAVCCFACETTLCEWTPEDVPDDVHKSMSDDCPFIRGRFRSFREERQEDWINSRPAYLNMRNRQQRFMTFKDWPNNLAQSKVDMVDAGFFYTEKSDRSVCFFCDIHIHKWTRDDIPIVEHARWKPNCPYVLAVMGEQFVNVVKKNGREAGRDYLNNKDIYQDNASLIKEQDCKICSNKADMTCDPCGHVVTCHDCSENMLTCPECGIMIKSMIKMYLA